MRTPPAMLITLAIAPFALHGCGWITASTPPNITTPTHAGVQPVALHDTRTPTPNQSAVATFSAGDPVSHPADDSPAQFNVTRVSFAEEGADFDPAVSHDGRKLFFASTRHRKTSDIYVKGVDARAVTQLTTDPADDEMPALSPDGSQIAFASNRAGNWDIYVMPAQGGKPVQVTGDPADEIHPSWSPDGNSLVFNRRGDSDSRWEMWIARTSNTATPTFVGYGLFPQWCPVNAGTGDRILFQLPRERGRRAFSLWTLDFRDGESSNQTEIASSADAAFIKPSWSPDGQWVVFAEIPAPVDGAPGASPSAPAAGTIWMASTQGEARVRLTTGHNLNTHPVWSSCGRVFYVSDRSGARSIWAMDVGQAVQSASLGNASSTNPITASVPHTPKSESSEALSADNTPRTAGAIEKDH